MAKVSMINREKRRAKLVAKYARKRAELKAIISNPDVGFEEPGADFLHHLVDVGLRQATLATDLLDDAFESGGQVVEHQGSDFTGSPCVAT